MQLLVLTCYTNLRGQFIARELVHGQTMENLDLEYKGKTYYFMSSKHKATFEKDPEKFIGGKKMHGGQDKIGH